MPIGSTPRSRRRVLVGLLLGPIGLLTFWFAARGRAPSRDRIATWLGSGARPATGPFRARGLGGRHGAAPAGAPVRLRDGRHAGFSAETLPLEAWMQTHPSLQNAICFGERTVLISHHVDVAPEVVTRSYRRRRMQSKSSSQAPLAAEPVELHPLDRLASAYPGSIGSSTGSSTTSSATSSTVSSGVVS